MDQRKFTIINQYIGKKLLYFILNIDENAVADITYENFSFNENQLFVLESLDKAIRQVRVNYINQDGFGDGAGYFLRSLSVDNGSLYNHYRNICGGVLPNIVTSDKLLGFLSKLCIKLYPSLLLKSSFEDMGFYGATLVDMNDMNTFISLVKTDMLNLITNQQEDLEYAFVFKTDDDLEFNIQVATACSTLIMRSFQNCCNRMEYDIESVIQEINRNISLLRDLAKGKEIEYSTFIGIRNLRFHDFKEIDFGCARIRQIDDISNPSRHTNSIASQHNTNDSKYYSGCVVEVKHKTKIVSNKSEMNYIMTEKIIGKQDNILDCVKFSIVFSIMSDRAADSTFYESGFPLVIPGNYSSSRERPSYFTEVYPKNLDDIGAWFQLLCNKDLSKVKVPLSRLKYAIFERSQAEDSIVDAIIAWEGMFSEAFETTFKVTGSISKFLYESTNRSKFYNRLKDLYNLRSVIVHGKNRSKSLLNKENPEKLRSEVIKIGLECMKKLLRDEELLELEPSDRVKKIMVLG